VLRTLIACVSATLLLSACGGSDDDTGDASLDSIEVTGDATPEVTVPEGFSADTTEATVVKEGGGETVAAGDTVKVNYIAVNGRTGQQFDSTYAGGRPATFTLSKGGILPGFIKALGDQKIGSRILAAIAPDDGFGQARTELDLRAGDTMVFVFDLVADVDTEITGAAQKLPADLPQVTYDDDDHPTGFTASKTTTPDPSEASLHVLVEGDGPVIEPGQTVLTNYVGQFYPDGKVFDSSRDKGAPQPISMVEGAAISCFTDQLPGQKVGSRVVLVCPPDAAYGADGRPPLIPGDSTLVFAVDLLDAS
jgi:peptidylprolyl isomerase